MDQAQEVLFQGAKLAEWGARLVIRLVQTGEWTALLVLLLSVYACWLLASRLLRTALWTLKWTVILFALLSAVGWADSSWTGRRPPGSRGVDWWTGEGAKAVPSGNSLPWDTLFANSKRDDPTAAWAAYAKSAGRFSFQAAGLQRVGETVMDQMPPEQRRKLQKKTKGSRGRR